MSVAAAGSDPVAEREFVERVAAIYRQAAPSGWGSAAVALCLVLVMGRFAPLATLAGWFALTLLAISVRIPLIRGYRADVRRDLRAPTWARRYLWMIGGIGICWALASFLMLQREDPFAIASLLTVLALVSGGAIASHSYLLPVVRLFLSLALLPAAVRLVWLGEASYLPMALTLFLFYLFLLAYARTQSRQLGEAIRLKHENLNLIEALKAEKAQADEMRQQAEQANLAKSRFLAAASHDLRQPMHALGLFSASLQEMAMEPEKRVVVNNIFASIDALESLFAELLDLSRLDAGFMQPAARHLRLAWLFDRLRDRYAPIAAAKGLELSFDAQEATVFADPALLDRTLGNLVANAIQYTVRGSVAVTAHAEGQEVILRVTDTGIGIAEQDRERVFEEFFQIGNPERDRRKGLGLGLAIVKRIATLTGTPLTLTSEPGRGSCFELRLPLGDANQARPDDDPQPAPGTGDLLRGKTVLVIDDEASVRDGMGALLDRWGCPTLLAGSAAEALAAIEARTPDLVVADLRLRGGASGIDAIDAIRRALGRDVPALIITGDTTMQAIRQVAHRNEVLVHKPVRPVRLRAALSQLLAQ